MAQRGMGLDWPTSLELIRRSVQAAKAWEAGEGRPSSGGDADGDDDQQLQQSG